MSQDIALVELRGFEPLLLPAEIPFDLQFHSISFRFGPARYLRVRFQVLTASRAATNTAGSCLSARCRKSSDGPRCNRLVLAGANCPECGSHLALTTALVLDLEDRGGSSY